VRGSSFPLIAANTDLFAIFLILRFSHQTHFKTRASLRTRAGKKVHLFGKPLIFIGKKNRMADDGRFC